MRLFHDTFFFPRWKFSKFSLKFRAIFENFEKEQKKKTDVFKLVGPLKVENLGPLKVEKFWGR